MSHPLAFVNTSPPVHSKILEITLHAERATSVSAAANSLFALSRAPLERAETSMLTLTSSPSTFEKTSFRPTVSLFTPTRKYPILSQLGVPPFSMITLPFASSHAHTSEVSPFITLSGFPPSAPIATLNVDVPQTL